MYNKQRNFTNPYFQPIQTQAEAEIPAIIKKFIKPELRKPDDELVEVPYGNKVYLMTEDEYLQFDDYCYKFIDIDYSLFE